MKWPEHINSVICGDAIETMKEIPDGAIDLVVMDPPYQLDLHCRSGRTTGFYAGRDANCFSEIHKSWNQDIDIPEVLSNVRRLQETFNAYIWCSVRQLNEYLSCAGQIKLRANVLVWVKANPMPLNSNGLLSDIEYCVHLTERGSYFANGLPFDRYSKVFYGSRILNMGHPTVKPIEFMCRHIAVSSRPDAIVLDPFAGSGTTLVATKQLGRRYIGIEINPKYCAIAEDRLRQCEMELR